MEISNELKLTKVVLFKIGIGSFQKLGKINLSKSKSMKLSFSKSVMNDLLKTFSILRLKGDLAVSGVSYEAKDSDMQKTLEDNNINLPSTNSLFELIKQLRGTKVLIDTANNSIEGQIIGTQTIEDAPKNNAIVPTEIVLVADKESIIQPIKINDIENLKILDVGIEKDFNYFLETIVGQNKEKNKIVTLFFEGEQQSEYILNFLQEIPSWKTSYRLFIDDAELNSKETETNQSMEFKHDAIIQGWAIIDNVLDEDWEGVDLTLVTGLPVSFIYDSYSPAWIARPKIERKTELGVNIVQYDRGLETGAEMPEAKPMSLKRKRLMKKREAAPAPPPCAAPMARAPTRPGGKGFGGARIADLSLGDTLEEEEEEESIGESAFEQNAEVEGGKGVAFKYKIGTPVFVKRNNSSLIPILQGETNGKLISIYNNAVNAKNPMLTYEFTNKTGLTLEKGPISIYIDKIFSGEAMLPFLENNDTCRLPYSVDQSVDIDYKMTIKTQEHHKLEIKDLVYQYYFQRYTHQYTMKNHGEIPKLIIIEHPKYKKRELYDSEKPTEETKNHFRFKFQLGAGESKKFTVKERLLQQSSLFFNLINFNLVDLWMKLKLINEKTKEYLYSLIKFMNQEIELSSEIHKLNGTIDQIYSEQERLRKNLSALKNSKSEKTLRQKYISKFDKKETELESIENQIKKLIKEKQTIADKVSNLKQEWRISNE